MTDEEKNATTSADAAAAEAPKDAEHVHGPGCGHDHGREYDEREPIEALEKVGELFGKVVHDVQPRRLIAEVQRGDRACFFRHFKGQRLEKFSRKKMTEILHKEVFGRENIFMAQLLMILWNEAHRDLYISMRNLVQTINEDVEAVERIEDDKGREFLKELMAKGFTRKDLYVCVRLNDVRFSEELIQTIMTPGSEEAEEAPASETTADVPTEAATA